MDVIGPSGFIFRDFIKFVLPTAIAAGLYAPFFVEGEAKISLTGLVVISVLLGYVIYSPIASLSDFIHSKIPIKKLRLDDANDQNKVLNSRWDYDFLWSTLGKDEREYLYLTQSYFEFYQTTGFYFLLYGISNTIILCWKIMEHLSSFTDSWRSFLLLVNSVKTPTIINFDIPTWIAIIISLVLAYYLFGDCSIEYSFLYGFGGAFDRYSQKYQKMEGNIASGIWGKVVGKDGGTEKTLEGIQLHLKNSAGEITDTQSSDKSGSFIFPKSFQICANNQCKIEINDKQWQGEITFTVESKSIPDFRVHAVLK